MSPSSKTAPRESYTPVAKLLHWVMAIIWLTAWVLGYLAVNWSDLLNPNFDIVDAHKALASTIIFLVVIRVFWRLSHPAPALPNSISPLLQRVAHWGHFILYAFALIALPLSGWMWSSIVGRPIMMLWIFHLPPLVAPHPEYAHLAKTVHLTIAWSMGALVLVHILAALKHYFIDRDGVLESMVPHGHSRALKNTEKKS
ncbi:cytochrome b [Rouxiella sp. Mn2063]|uniref:cytochrome b n=1 Tax=Rouxiella sp. Mn2063 TaxID=3395262 RepID=UPI003BE3D60B